MPVSDDAKFISASILTVAAELSKIEKRLDKRATNDQQAQQEVSKAFESMLSLTRKS